MAERSIGISTGSGDGDVGGYSSDRITTMWSKTIGNGILRTGNKFNVSGTTTANVTVDTGAVVNNGYFYENTSSVNLTAVGVANGTYYLVVKLNNTASAVTVIRSEGTGATNTTIAAYTCRLALVAVGSYSTATDILIASVVITAGVLTSFSYYGRQIMASTIAAPAQIYSEFQFSNASVATATTTSPAYSAGLINADTRFINFTNVGSVMTMVVVEPGTYLWDVFCAWGTNTTGSRAIIGSSATEVNNNSNNTQVALATALANPANPVAGAHVQRVVWTATYPVSTTTNTVTVGLYQNSGAALLAIGAVRCTRL